jgi:hypothetical protein
MRTGTFKKQCKDFGDDERVKKGSDGWWLGEVVAAASRWGNETECNSKWLGKLSYTRRPLFPCRRKLTAENGHAKHWVGTPRAQGLREEGRIKIRMELLGVCVVQDKRASKQHTLESDWKDSSKSD